MSGGGAIETPSGKDRAYENFPVGSWLLPAPARPHVAVFYFFARAIDDIADNPDLGADEKIRRLDAFETAVMTGAGDADAFAKAHAMRRSLAETGVTADHCRDLVAAFKQDAGKGRYGNWDDLLAYCRLSAAPVGRYLLDLTGGHKDGYPASDALCLALQVINHLQDCKDDYLTLDRVYLPGDWMAAAGAHVDELGGDRASPALRAVIDRCIMATQALMADARALPGGLMCRRLALESQAIINIADALLVKLARRDPLGPRIELSKPGYLWCCLRGVLSASLR